MENITKIRYSSLPADSPYVKPSRMYYVQNGKEKNWDLLKVHDSVSIIILNKTRNTLVFVKQFRPGDCGLLNFASIFNSYLIKTHFYFGFSTAVYHSIITSDSKNTAPETIDLEKYPARLAITHELCAGIVDKRKTLREIAQEEVLEECGYNVPLERIEQIMTYRYRALLLLHCEWM